MACEAFDSHAIFLKVSKLRSEWPSSVVKDSAPIASAISVVALTVSVLVAAVISSAAVPAAVEDAAAPVSPATIAGIVFPVFLALLESPLVLLSLFLASPVVIAVVVTAVISVTAVITRLAILSVRTRARGKNYPQRKNACQRQPLHCAPKIKYGHNQIDPPSGYLAKPVPI